MLYRRRSPAQVAASRRNGALSRGPVTPEGKRNASLNLQGPPHLSLVKAAKSILIPGESEADFVRLSGYFLNRLKPNDYLESILVQRMVVAHWQLLRVWGFEQLALITAPEDDSEDPAARSYSNYLGLHTQSRAGNSFQVSAQRYQRQYDQALAQLERLRGNVNLLPNPRSGSKQTATSEFPEPRPNLEHTQADPPHTHAEPGDASKSATIP